jgi:hypothetical protein
MRQFIFTVTGGIGASFVANITACIFRPEGNSPFFAMTPTTVEFQRLASIAIFLSYIVNLKTYSLLIGIYIILASF